MEIHVLIVPETSDYISDVLIGNKIWINKNLGMPQLEHWNAKYVVPYWLDPEESRGANRIFKIQDVKDAEDSYEISLGDSYRLPKTWQGLKEGQVRRFQYERLTVFNLLEKSDGSLTEMTKEMNKRYFSDESLATLPKKRNTFLDEFWWGNNIKIKKYWNAYYSGDKFMYQYFSHDSFILEISFKDKPKEYPLFNIEPIIKTLQSYNSYLEKESLLEDKPDIGNPLLLQEISRGSEILTFVGFYGSIIGLLVLYEKYKGQRLNNALAKKKIDGQSLSNDLARSKIEGQKLKNLDDAIEILEKRYPKIYANYQKNKLPKELSEALQNLISEGVSKVAISRKPMNKDDFDGSKNDLDEFEI